MLEKILWVSKNERDYLTKKLYLEDYKELDKTIVEPQFTISQLNITARDATYWDKQGILPRLKGNGARRKYDLIQSIWIRLIPQMRSLGVSIENIKKFKDSIYDFEIPVQDFLENKAFMDQLHLLSNEKVSKERLNELLNSERFKNIIQNESLNIFQMSIMYVILFRKKVSLIVTKEGYFVPYSHEIHYELVNEDDNYKKLLEQPHFSVSLNLAYADLVNSWKDEPFFEEISIISEEELKILNEIRKPNITSITIKYKEGRPDLLETIKNQEVDLATRFFDVITKNGYHTITIKSKNGSIVNFENKVLKKVKSIR